jgi:hypothetical protein
MERELHLIELYDRQFEEARRLLQEEIERPGSTELDGLLEDMDAKWNTLFRLYEIVINGSAIEQLEARVGAMETSRSRYIRTRKVAEKKKERDPNAPSTSGLSNTTHRVLAAAMAKLTAAKVPTFEVAKKERLCFICLRKGHQAAKCGNPNPNCRRCNQRHHTALCRETKKDDQNKPASPTSGGSTTCFVSLPQEQNVYLKTATVFVHGPKGRLKVTCMIDEGSQRSYVSESAACKSRKSALRRSQYAHSCQCPAEYSPNALKTIDKFLNRILWCCINSTDLFLAIFFVC